MPRETNLDRLVRLAAGLFDVPMAAVAVADAGDVRLGAVMGADTPGIERALVAWSREVLRSGLTVVPDVQPDGQAGKRVLAGAAASPLRFVAGIPLAWDAGAAVGTLLVADRLPRPDLGPSERLLLRDLVELARPFLEEKAGQDVAAERAARLKAEIGLADARRQADAAHQRHARFFSAANHDLRQPFQAMHLFLHLLQAKLTDARQRELSARLEQALCNGEAMLSNVLDLAALDSGRTRPMHSSLRVADVLERQIAEFEAAALAKGLRLRYVPTGLTVETDAGLFERMVRHLMANAVRATAEGSVLLGCRLRGGSVAVEVWDTGPGIAQGECDAIWGPFHQIGGSDGDRSGRLGLGLAIVKGTAELLGGSVTLCSRPGRGSMFRILLPGGRVGEAAPNTGGRGERQPILVIEDDPVQLMAVRMILEGWGCAVIAVPTLERALAAVAERGRPGLILSDLRLRGTESGLDALAAVRQATDAPVPAILMTGDTGPEQVRAAKEAEASLLHKPFGPEHLRAAIEFVTGWSLTPGGR